MPVFQHGGLGKRRKLWNTYTLLGILVLIILGQFLMFPLFLSNMLDSANIPAGNGLSQFRKSSKPQIPNRRPDGTFNGAPIYLQKSGKPLSSTAHCIGDNYQPGEDWKQRSCHFGFMCFNTSNQEFLLFSSPTEQERIRQMTPRDTMYVSSSLTNHTVSIGGINMKWGAKQGQGIPRLEWFPTIVQQTNALSVPYYTLPDAVVLIPFHSMNGANPGHLVWDDWLPIYTLLHMFQMFDKDLLLMRYVLSDGERGLWASCDLRQEKREACRKIMNKFAPLMLGPDYPYHLSTTQEFDFQPQKAGMAELVCAKHGLGGIGSLTDHGVHKMHGWEENDYHLTHNHGRGGNLFDFRNFMMRNMGFTATHLLPEPVRIVFAQNSSDVPHRSLDFERQMALVRENFPSVKVEGYVMRTKSLTEQLKIAASTSVYVSVCGGGAVNAMFLPAGATAILYYAEDGGVENGRSNGKPALLDWDLFNAMSHLRVHWLPMGTRNTATDEQAFVRLIHHELLLIASL